MEARGDDEPPVTGTTPGEAVLEPVLGLVSRSPVYVSPDATLRTVAGVLAEESIGAVLVRGAQGPAGIVSERDVVNALAGGAQPDRERARDVMTPEPASVASSDPILAVADHMLGSEIRHLVVTKNNTTVGVVSMRDVLAVFADERRATGRRPPPA